MKKLFFLIVLFCGGIFLPLIAQNGNTNQIYFNKLFDLPDTTIAGVGNGAVLDDGYLFTGNWGFYDDNSGVQGFLALKTDFKGNIQTIKYLYQTEGLAMLSAGGDVTATLDGNYLLVGTITYADGTENEDLLFTKYNKDGEIIWQHALEKPNTVEQCFGTSTTQDGGYIVAGRQRTFSQNGRFFILKTDSMGNEQWSHQYHPLQHGAAFSIFETDTGYIASGAIQYPDTDHDMFVMEIDEQGNVVWEKNYGGVESDNGGLITPIDNNFFLAGAIKQNNITNPYIARLDSIGNTMWTKTYHVSIGGMQEAPPQLTSDGGFVCLYSYDTEFGYRAPWFWRFTATGDTLWTRRIPGMPADHNSYLKDIAPTHDGGWLLSGFDYSEQSSWAVKLDSLGHTCSYLGCDSTASVGLSFVPPPPQTAQLNIMPNPAKEFVTLSWATTPSAKAELLIYDYMGKIVLRRFVSGNAANINLDYLPNGLYICQITDNGMMVASGKMTIFK